MVNEIETRNTINEINRNSVKGKKLRSDLRSMSIGQSIIIQGAPEIVKVTKGYKYTSGVKLTERYIVETYWNIDDYEIYG